MKARELDVARALVVRRHSPAIVAIALCRILTSKGVERAKPVGDDRLDVLVRVGHKVDAADVET